VAAIARVLVADIEEAIIGARDEHVFATHGSKAMKMKGACRSAQVCMLQYWLFKSLQAPRIMPLSQKSLTKAGCFSNREMIMQGESLESRTLAIRLLYKCLSSIAFLFASL